MGEGGLADSWLYCTKLAIIVLLFISITLASGMNLDEPSQWYMTSPLLLLLPATAARERGTEENISKSCPLNDVCGDKLGELGIAAVISAGVFQKFSSDAFLCGLQSLWHREFKQLPWEVGYSLHRTYTLNYKSGMLSLCWMAFSGEKLILSVLCEKYLRLSWP